MTNAEFFDPDVVDVNYSGTVTAAAFSQLNFALLPELANPDSIAQRGPTGLRLQFSFAVDDQTDLEYTGSVPGVETPQTIPIS